MLNASVAIGMAEALRSQGINISKESIMEGIKNADWPGRLEIIGRNPLILVDGAQNKASARVLAEAIKKLFRYRNLVLVFGVSKDKDVVGMLEELMPIADSIIFTRSNVVARALDPSKIKEISGRNDASVKYSVEDAVDIAVKSAAPDDLVLITGSLFIVGEAREIYKECVKVAQKIP